MTKRLQRREKQQEYRDNLAHDVKNLRNRYGDTWKELAKTLLKDQQENSYEYLDSLWKDRLNKKLAMQLMEKGDKKSMIFLEANIEKFKDLDKEVALKLIECWLWWTILHYYEKFDGLVLDEDIALKLINSKDSYGESWWRSIPYHLEKFKWINLKKIAMKLIESGEWSGVVDNLDKFWLDHNEVVNKLIDSYQWWLVLYNWKTFKWVKRDEVVKKMFDKWDWYKIVTAREKIDPDSHYGLNAEQKENLTAFLDWLVLNQDLAEKLINVPNKTCRTGAILINCLQYFEWLDYKKLALELIDKWYGIEVGNNIWKFKNLDGDVDHRLVYRGKTHSHRKIDPKIFKEIFWYDIV